jgi:6-phosphogluconolactonase (cycloisomerase 2 family)
LVAVFGERIGAFQADISADGKWMAAPTRRLITFQVFSVDSHKRVAIVKDFPWGWRGPRVDVIRFDADGKYLVVGSREAGRLAVYRLDP